ncbi:hypothetical protein ACSBR2_019899 [Camellia fascicularis]
MDLVEWLEGFDYQNPPLMNGYDLICAKLDGLDSNLAMFEDGFDLIHFSCYIKPEFGEGKVLILPSTGGEGSFGRVVVVTLPEDELSRCVKMIFCSL